MRTDDLAALRSRWHDLQARHARGGPDATGAATELAAVERRIVDAVVAHGPVRPAPRVPRPLAAGVAAFVAVLALAGYAVTGSPGLALSPPVAEADPATSPDAMVQRLAARLARDPSDATGWAMLGRSYLVLERPAEAVTAYRRALALKPDDADLLADTADAVASAQERRLDGEPMALVERALAIAPDHPKARMLAGSAAWRRGDRDAAAGHWQRVVATGAADDPLVALARQGLDRLNAAPATRP